MSLYIFLKSVFAKRNKQVYCLAINRNGKVCRLMTHLKRDDYGTCSNCERKSHFFVQACIDCGHNTTWMASTNVHPLEITCNFPNHLKVALHRYSQSVAEKRLIIPKKTTTTIKPGSNTNFFYVRKSQKTAACSKRLKLTRETKAYLIAKIEMKKSDKIEWQPRHPQIKI